MRSVQAKYHLGDRQLNTDATNFIKIEVFFFFFLQDLTHDQENLRCFAGQAYDNLFTLYFYADLGEQNKIDRYISYRISELTTYSNK